jgi:hypothetical protein
MVEASEQAYEEAYDALNNFRETHPPKGGYKAITKL